MLMYGDKHAVLTPDFVFFLVQRKTENEHFEKQF